MVRTITAAAALAFAGSAFAVPQGSYWVQVDNSTSIAMPGGTGFENSWSTYDLYVALEPGDLVAALDFGIGGGNTGMSTDGTLFNDNPFSGDSVAANLGFAALVDNLEYDSAVTVNGGAITFVADPPQIDFDSPGWPGAWFVNPQQAGTGGPNGPDDMWVARITVSNDTSFLGGQMFVAGTGPNGDFGLNIADIPLGVINVANAIPTPGAMALFGLAGVAAIRRRR